MSRPLSDEDVFRAIGHHIRRDILLLLRDGPRSPTDLENALRIAAPLLSQHLRVLRNAGVIAQQRVGAGRIYRLQTRAIGSLRRWIARFEGMRP